MAERYDNLSIDSEDIQKPKHPENLIEFAIYKVKLRNGENITAQFVKFARKVVFSEANDDGIRHGTLRLHLLFDSPDDHRAWCIDWSSIKAMKLWELP